MYIRTTEPMKRVHLKWRLFHSSNVRVIFRLNEPKSKFRNGVNVFLSVIMLLAMNYQMLVPMEWDGMEEYLNEKIEERFLSAIYNNQDEIQTPRNGVIVRKELPNLYYPSIDFSFFQPWMCYTAITSTTSQAWSIVRSERAYSDNYGFRRFKIPDDQFKVDGEDDYLIALGNYYKEKGLLGQRYLIVTENGMYTAITGDEKDDAHTDDHQMFSRHGRNLEYAGVIEWIIDRNSENLPDSVWNTGTVTNGPIHKFHGEILSIYRIS